MLRLSMSELTTYRWSFEEDVAQIAAAGYSGIGIWRDKLTDYGIDRGIKLLEEYQLHASSLTWAGGFTGSDGRRTRDALQDTWEAIQIAAHLRAAYLVVHPGARAGHTWNHARRLVTRALERLIPYAEEFDIKLAIEPMNETCACGWTFLTDLDDTLAVLEDLKSDRVKLVLDTYHLFHPETTSNHLPRLASLVDRIGVVHVGDAKRSVVREQNRCRLGEGTVPLREILSALMRAGYDGYFEVELIGQDVEMCEYQSLLADSKEVIQELASVAW